MIFGVLQAVSNFGYWLLAVTDKQLWSMASAVFVEIPVRWYGHDGICSTVNDAVQQVLFRHPVCAAVGAFRRWPGLCRSGCWLVELWGWPTFYAFTVIAGLPGLLLLFCRQTLDQVQQSGTFLVRCCYPQGYRWTNRLFAVGCSMLALWLLTLALDALGVVALAAGLPRLFEIGMALTLLAVLAGVLLD